MDAVILNEPLSCSGNIYPTVHVKLDALDQISIIKIISCFVRDAIENNCLTMIVQSLSTKCLVQGVNRIIHHLLMLLPNQMSCHSAAPPH